MRLLAILSCFTLTMAWLPRWWCGRSADDYYDGERSTQHELARWVARRVVEHPAATFYQTDSLRFEGQSAVAIYQMTLLGLGQIVLEHPTLRAEYLPAMQRAADRLVDPETLRYAATVYGEHGVERMDPGEGHAYLGYINLGLGMLRLVDPSTHHGAVHDRITAELAKRLDESPTGLIETYPGESWPPDVAAVAGSIGLHARATGKSAGEMLARWAERFSRCSIDPSGYLIQRVRTGTCEPLDRPRGSGTAVAAYFLGFATPELARQLHHALAQVGRRSLAGFAALREYPPGVDGSGDGNSGPVIAGVSVGATGFGLGSARMHGDRELFRELYRTVHLAGVPSTSSEGTAFAVGGALGNALLLAMLTARMP